jgi:nitroreductase
MTTQQVKAIESVMRARRSVRDFAPTEVPEDLIQSILEHALLAPSWSNTRPYRFAVAQGESRDRISAALLARADDLLEMRSAKPLRRLRAFLRAPGLLVTDFRIPIVYPEDLRPRQGQLAKALFTHMGIERFDRGGRDDFVRRNMEFFGAPVAIFIFARRGMGVYSALDAGLALQNLMLAATARGLGSCAQGFLAFWSKPIREEFHVPKGYKLLCGMSLGYPAQGHINDFVPPGTALGEVRLAQGIPSLLQISRPGGRFTHGLSP